MVARPKPAPRGASAALPSTHATSPRRRARSSAARSGSSPTSRPRSPPLPRERQHGPRTAPDVEHRVRAHDERVVEAVAGVQPGVPGVEQVVERGHVAVRIHPGSVGRARNALPGREDHVRRLGRPPDPPRGHLLGPVEIRVRDDRGRAGDAFDAGVLRRVRVRDEDRVVAAREAAVQRRADADVPSRRRSRRSGRRPPPRAPPPAPSPRRRPRTPCRAPARPAAARERGRAATPGSPAPAPRPGAAPTPPAPLGARPRDESRECRHHLVAAVGVRHHPVLHVDDEECGAGTVREGGHDGDSTAGEVPGHRLTRATPSPRSSSRSRRAGNRARSAPGHRP